MLGAQSVAKAFPEYPTTIVKVYPPALHLKDYISMAGPEIMTVGKSEGAQKTFLVIKQDFLHQYCNLWCQIELNEWEGHCVFISEVKTLQVGRSCLVDRLKNKPFTVSGESNRCLSAS